MADRFSSQLMSVLILSLLIQTAAANNDDDNDGSNWWSSSVYIWFAVASFVLMFGLFLMIACIRCYKMKRARIASQNGRSIPLNAYPRGQNASVSNDHAGVRYPLGPMKPPSYQPTIDQASQEAPPSYDQLYSSQQYNPTNEQVSSAPTTNTNEPSAPTPYGQFSYGTTANENILPYPNSPQNDEGPNRTTQRASSHPQPGNIY